MQDPDTLVKDRAALAPRRPAGSAKDFRPWAWNPEDFAQACEALRRTPAVADHVSGSRYPLHMLRYWICGKLLGAHLQGLHAPRVMEIGVDRGQFFHFYRAMPEWVPSAHWHGADVSEATRALLDQGYQGMHLADFTDAAAVQALIDDPAHRGQYDAVVVLHFLEHLTDPEACLRQIRQLLKPDGVLVGGMPGCPEFAREARERHIRPRAGTFGHQSVFSVQRLEQAFDAIGLKEHLITGAFFARSRDSRLEDAAGWLRFNLWFGRHFPGWPGEVYFSASEAALRTA